MCCATCARHGRLRPGPRREDRASRRSSPHDDGMTTQSTRFPSPTIRSSLTILTARYRRATPVNTAGTQRIRALVGTLAKPLASCPGADRLASFRAALTQLCAVSCGESRIASCFGVLDVCNHRVDAWFTALATRRLESLRATAPQGVVIGGWGCLQDVRRPDPVDPRQRAEYIHTPSLDQAAAAAVMRSAARRATAADSHHADIDLSSRRVRLARWILEGVRNGRSLGELLGVRFERAVKGTPAETHLAQLRTRFRRPAGSACWTVCAAAEGRPSLDHRRARGARGAEGMSEALDAVADALTAEAVYQIVKGQPGERADRRWNASPAASSRRL